MIQSYRRGVIAGMELAMRICRNRKKDLSEIMSGSDAQGNRLNEIETCVGIIRIAQVEIGAGRMPLPEFTLDEQDEINRIR